MGRSVPLLLLGAVLLAGGLVAFLAWEGGPGAGRTSREGKAIETSRERVTPLGKPPAKADAPPPGPLKMRITGRVSDPSGRPIPGAHVGTVVTDAKGHYALATDGAPLALDVWAIGFLPYVYHHELLVGDGPWEFDFELQPAPTVRGRVTGEGGAPVKGALVYAISAEHQILDNPGVANTCLTDADGRYAFPGFAIERTDLGVKAAGYLPALVPDVIIASGLCDFDLKRGRSVHVTIEGGKFDNQLVRASDSRLRGMLLPPGGLQVLANGLSGRAFIEYPVVLGFDRLDGVGPGPADFAALLQTLPEPGRSVLFDSTADEVTLTLVPIAQVRVAVTDGLSGAPLTPLVERFSGGAGPFEVTVAMDGACFVAGDDRPQRLRFSLRGYETTELSLDGREEPYEVTMQPVAEGETGTFHLLLEPPLDPAGRVAIVGRDHGGRRLFERYVERADEEGRFTPDPVPVGEYTLSVLATGMIPVTLPRIVVVRGHKETHRVSISPGGGLEMKVTDAEGTLLDEVYLQLTDAGGHVVDIHILTRVSEGRAFVSVNYLPSATTARAESGLAEGVYTLTAVREGYEVGRREFVVRGRDVAAAAIVLRRR